VGLFFRPALRRLLRACGPAARVCAAGSARRRTFTVPALPSQAWCQPGLADSCYTHPLVNCVHDRVVNLTGVPKDNAEFYQILKYETGQFYRSHHDQNSEPDSIIGARLFTFFIYLQTPEGGGGTRFPLLNITVQPKRGTALLWPNVKDSDVREADMRTKHEVRPARPCPLARSAPAVPLQRTQLLAPRRPCLPRAGSSTRPTSGSTSTTSDRQTRTAATCSSQSSRRRGCRPLTRARRSCRGRGRQRRASTKKTTSCNERRRRRLRTTGGVSTLCFHARLFAVH